jgi:hypothetical protein
MRGVRGLGEKHVADEGRADTSLRARAGYGALTVSAWAAFVPEGDVVSLQGPSRSPANSCRQVCGFIDELESRSAAGVFDAVRREAVGGCRAPRNASRSARASSSGWATAGEPGDREQQPGGKCEPQDQRDEPVAQAATRLAGVDLFKRRL